MKNKKFVSVADLIQNFEFEIVYKGNTKNKITIPSLNRTGIELASKKVYKTIMSAVLWSGNESHFLSKFKSVSAIEKSIENVLTMSPPVIIVTTSFKPIKPILKMAKKYRTTVLRTPMSSFELYQTVAPWINEQLVEYKTVHGTLVSVYGTGVLITGESGIGKSEIALELVKKGHTFVADDAVDIANIGGKIIGKANLVAKNFIEVRGLGILNVPRMFGYERIKKNSTIDLMIELCDESAKDNNFERLGAERKQKTIEKVKVPFYKLPITAGRKMSELIEVAVADLKLREEGYNSANEYLQNFKKVNR